MKEFTDIIGRKLGRYTVEFFVRKDKWGHAVYHCRCICGMEKDVLGTYLLNGHTKSCGCFKREETSKRTLKHGKIRTKEYRAWQAMKNRCYNKSDPHYKNWGGRGITVCSSWLHSFENFYADMGDCPEGYSLDRIDNNGNYYKENCHWATQKEQQNNRRNNK